MDDIRCGVWVKEIVSGFTGVVTAVSHYISGCTHCCVEQRARKKDNGDTIEQWFDIRRLHTIAGKKRIVLADIDSPASEVGRSVGGPGPSCSNAHP